MEYLLLFSLAENHFHRRASVWGLNAYEKDLPSECYCKPFKCLESVQRINDTEFCVLLSEENDISRDLDEKFIFYLQFWLLEHLKLCNSGYLLIVSQT